MEDSKITSLTEVKNDTFGNQIIPIKMKKKFDKTDFHMEEFPKKEKGGSDYYHYCILEYLTTFITITKSNKQVGWYNIVSCFRLFASSPKLIYILDTVQTNLVRFKLKPII